MAIEQYHGQELRDGRLTRPVPPPPPDFDPRRGPPPRHLHGHPIAGLDPSHLRQLDTVGPPERCYPQIRLIGNYDLGCVDTQTVTYQDVTPMEARWHAWEAFGVCPHVILYFDEQGRVAAKE